MNEREAKMTVPVEPEVAPEDDAAPLGLETIVRVLKAAADHRVSLFWRSYEGSRDTLRLIINCSDFFAWACADGVAITPSNAQDFLDTCADVERELGGHPELGGVVDRTDLLFCARQRGMRPQGAYYEYLYDPEEVWFGLFDACGPDRADDPLFDPVSLEAGKERGREHGPSAPEAAEGLPPKWSQAQPLTEAELVSAMTILGDLDLSVDAEVVNDDGTLRLYVYAEGEVEDATSEWMEVTPQALDALREIVAQTGVGWDKGVWVLPLLVSRVQDRPVHPDSFEFVAKHHPDRIDLMRSMAARTSTQE